MAGSKYRERPLTKRFQPALIILIILTAIGAMYQSPGQADVDVTPLPEAAKSGDYYLMATSADMAWFRDAVNAGSSDLKARLTADIDLGGAPNKWTPIGNYNGIFEGQGYRISGLYIDESVNNNCGFFGVVTNGGVIKDLTVQGSVAGSDYVGGVAGNNNGKVINCVNQAAVLGLNSVGGVVGFLGDNGSVKNCVNEGTVSFSGDAIDSVKAIGGITGLLNVGSPSVENCVNKGTVAGACYGVGGVAGRMWSGTVRNCVNQALVSGDKQVGGVVGRIAPGTSGGNPTVTRCVNTANVKGTSEISLGTETQQYGGVVGYKDPSKGTVSDCLWLKDDTISPDYALGYNNSGSLPSGCTSEDSAAELPVATIILNDYFFETGSFDIRAAAYPASSDQAKDGLKLTYDVITINPPVLSSDVKTSVTAAGGTVGKSYDVTVALNTTPAASKDLKASVAFTVMLSGAPPSYPSTSGSSGGCNAGFAMLALLVLVPLCLKRR